LFITNLLRSESPQILSEHNLTLLESWLLP
jgi:hypothetical protein